MRELYGYMEYLPAMQAEQSQRLAEAIAIGTGSLKKNAARRVVRRWQRAIAKTQNRSRHAEPPTKEEFMTKLAILGIKYGPPPEE